MRSRIIYQDDAREGPNVELIRLVNGQTTKEALRTLEQAYPQRTSIGDYVRDVLHTPRISLEREGKLLTEVQESAETLSDRYHLHVSAIAVRGLAEEYLQRNFSLPHQRAIRELETALTDSISEIARGEQILVASRALRFLASPYEFMDLIQEGNIGLRAAVVGYDGRIPFRAYASRRIYWYLQNTVNPRGRQHSVETIPVEEVSDLLEDRSVTSPIEAVIGMNRRKQMQNVLQALSPREAEILQMRFSITGGDASLEEVGRKFTTTRERIREIETKALRRLRHPSRSKQLEAFLRGSRPSEEPEK